MLRDLESSGFSPATSQVSTDADLLGRFVEGRDEQAFRMLVQRHVPLVYRAALRQLQGDAHRAEEATQQVFTLLAQKAKSLAGHPSVTGWLYTTTHYTVRSVQRTERRRRLREQEIQAMSDPSPAAEIPAADWGRLMPIVDEALRELGGNDRDVILARFFDQCGYAQIGGRFAITEDAARMRVERALQKLRAVLARRGVTSTTSALALAFASEGAMAVPAGLASTIASAALAGAAVSSGVGTWGMVAAFMTANKVVVALVVALAIAITAGFYSSERESRALASHATMGSQDGAAQARLADLLSRAETAEQRHQELKAELRESQAAVAAAVVAARSAADKAAAQAAAARLADTTTFGHTALPLLRNDPILKDLRVRRHRWNVTEDYGPIFREFGFSRAQSEKFIGLFVDWAEMRPERGERWSIDPYIDGIVPTDEFVEKIRAEFGDAVADRFRELQGTRNSRWLVNFLEAHLYYLDEPFTVEQAKQLGKLIDGASLPGGGDPKPDRIDWTRVLPQAESVLSARQMEGLRSLAAQGRMTAMLKSAAEKR